jgi:hypothetical protein
MEVKSYWKLFFGILFVVFGLAGIFDLWSGLVFEVPWQVWPIGLIVVGVLFIANRRGFAFLGIGLLLVFGIFNGVFYVADNVEVRDFVYGFDVGEFDRVDLSLNYGAGSLILGRSDYSDKIYFEGVTADFEDPRVIERVEDGVKEILISRNGGVCFGDDEVWRVFLADDAVYDLDFEYGVSDVSLDLRGLDVDRLEIGEGVSDTEIWFGDYPSDVEIQGGLSDVELKFSGDVGVVIRADGGLVDKDFDGFEKRGSRWYSLGYDEDGESIDIRFNGGVGDLSAEFVEA